MKIFSDENDLCLFDIPVLHETLEERIRNSYYKSIYLYRAKTIKAGNMAEVEIYPVYVTPSEASRAKKAKPSREAQENLNHRNMQKKTRRMANNNFTSADLWATLGFDKENLPPTPEAARKIAINFIRRLKRKYKKLGLPPLKYIYVVEWKEAGKDGEKPIRCHIHIIMSGGMDRDAIEEMWKHGGNPQARRLHVREDCGLNGLASYISKGRKNEKLWGHSQNLKMPVPTIADRKITPKQAAKIAINENDAPAYFEKLYKGYAFRSIEIKRSDFISGVYIYVEMYKKLPRKERKNEDKNA